MITHTTGETLKGIFFAFSRLLKEDHLELKIKSFYKFLEAETVKMMENEGEKVELIEIHTIQNTRFIKKSSEYAKSRESMIKDLKALKNAVIDYIKQYEIKLKNCSEENEQLSISVSAKEKKILEFSIDYETTKEKLKEAQALLRNGKLEFLCKFCNKSFFEEENFNWSCLTHNSE